MAFKLAFASDCLERAWNLMKFGMAIAARMPMMATTIISSMRVKPLLKALDISDDLPEEAVPPASDPIMGETLRNNSLSEQRQKREAPFRAPLGLRLHGA